MSFLSHPPPKESLAWEQPTPTFGVKPTLQQLKKLSDGNLSPAFLHASLGSQAVLFIQAAAV